MGKTNIKQRLHGGVQAVSYKRILEVKGFSYKEECRLPTHKSHVDRPFRGDTESMKHTMRFKDFDFQFKIVLVGDDGVGKTTLLRSFTESCFNTSVRPHDVADVETKIIHRHNSRVKLHVWDTAGLERFQSLTGSYYRNAHGCIIMFDISNEQSFHNANTWLADARRHCPAETRMILVATKCNEPKRREVSHERAETLAREMDIPYMEVGAQQNFNINRLFETLSDVIVADIRKAILEKKRQRNINLSMQSPVSHTASQLITTLKKECFPRSQCPCG